MPKFYYQGKDKQGSLVKGTLDAEDAWVARKEVKRLDLDEVDVQPASALMDLSGRISEFRTLSSSVTIEERLIFLSQMETGLAVGIPLLTLFEMIIAEIRHPKFREALKDVSAQVAQGKSMHEAFARHPEFFNPTFISLIKTGEASGQLENVLLRLFKLTEQESENKARVKSALFYPAIVVFFLVVVTLILCYFVIPKIKTFLASFGQELPWITRFVVGASDFMLSYGWLVFLALGGVFYLVRNYYRTAPGRLRFDQWKLKMPVIGIFLLQVELNNFCVVLDLLLEAGIPLPDGLEMLSFSQSNQVVRNDLARTRDVVMTGTSFRSALGEGEVFPRNLVSLIGVGEEAGRIPEVLRRMARYYQLQIDHRLQNLPKLIEPILLSVIFVFVLILALAIFLPIWKMSSAVGGIK